MKIRILCLPLIFFKLSLCFSQNYTSYFTGSTSDLSSSPSGGICLMGGATENDAAMKWFLQKADHGDVLVLRASGSDGYNDYMYSDLGVSLNSVETIVFNDASAASEAYVLDKIKHAEAIWFAGGDQWNYVSYWRNTAVDSLVNIALQERNIAIGGTSAGMAIQGGFYFSAENGSVTSAEALSDPYNSYMSVDSATFIQNDILADVITDTHYDSPDRKGRHITFLARILEDYGIAAKGIACDEYTAVCIDANGSARVYGDYPSNDDNAYFIQTNCELESITPEDCASGHPLNWNLAGNAIKVYKVKGTSGGTHSFNLNNWQTGSGGVWENWYVSNGTLMEVSGTQLTCSALSLDEATLSGISLYPNPVSDLLTIESDELISKIELIDLNGSLVFSFPNVNSSSAQFNLDNLNSGIYCVKITSFGKIIHEKMIKD